jgi:hypothetical protein
VEAMSSDTKISSYQNGVACGLAIISGILTGWQGAFVVINMLLFMELIQMETTFYILLYTPTTLGVTLIWVGLHQWFVNRYKPHEYGDEASRVTPTELSRVRSLQFAIICLNVLIVAASLVFSAEFPGDIAPGDGHIVQNGMDTKSAIYTLWLVILLAVLLGGTYTITHAVYLFDLYLNQFRKPYKPSQQ